jgi:hypothetical protein
MQNVPLTLILSVCDLAVAGWLVAAWPRQTRHREFYVLVVSLLLGMAGWLGVLGVT